MPPAKHEPIESVALYRGGQVVSSLAAAQGRGLRETRLTALLGYLISLHPQPFLDLFRFPGQPRELSVEHHEDNGRSDIRIATDRGIGIVEAKVAAVDASRQAKGYNSNWRVLLTQYRTPRTRQDGPTLYLHWQDLLPALTELAKSPDYKQRFVAHDLIRYLQEHHMVTQEDTVEIYARELNDEATVNMFLHGRAYGCGYAKNSRLAEALYFAPHFGQTIAHQIPGIQRGISYVARIKHVEVVRTWKDFVSAIQTTHGRPWWSSYQDVYKRIHKHWDWTNDSKHRSILLLDSPRLVFNPPVKKDNLQKGKGWLSKRFLTFDQLFEAWKG